MQPPPEHNDAPRYSVLEVPEFDSTIPPHLTDALDRKDQYVVSTLSRIEQQVTWVIKSVCEASNVQVELHSRVSALEAWRQQMTGKWAIIAAIMFTVLIPIGIGIIVSVFSRKIAP